MSSHLGKIQPVELRNVWGHEAHDFTMWLVDNIDELGAALNLKFTDARREEAMLSRRVDIVASNEGHQVVVENQLNLTDDGHLGQLLIYAAGKNAKQIIWVARDFREEHRQALEWLNQHTEEEVRFFGVAVELWQIYGSRPAPTFRVVVAPGGWRGPGIQQVIATRQAWQNSDFCKELADALRLEHNIDISRWSGNSPWNVLEYLEGDLLRYAAIWYEAPAVEFIIEKKGADGREWNQSVFDQLQQHQQAIDAAIIDPSQDEWFTWKSVGQWSAGGINGCQIAVHRPGSVHNNTEEWGEYRSWIIGKYLRFRELLAPYLAEILAQTEDAPEAEE